MAKKQRGEKNLSLKKENVEEKTQILTLELESSDDEAPEEIKFEDSKAEAEKKMKQALDSVKREKELLKEKRRKRQMLFQEQKKRKLLSDDVLEEIDSASSKKQRASEDEAEEAEVEEEKKKKKKKKKKSGKMAHTRNLKGSYTVTTGKEQALTSCQQAAAHDFVQSRLYGAGTRRSTSNELLSIQNKKGNVKGAAVQFLKKDWACKEKAKAEKMKKRWIHKQKIPSS